MGYLNSYAYFLPIHSLYQIVSIKLCHNSWERYKCDKGIHSEPIKAR